MSQESTVHHGRGSKDPAEHSCFRARVRHHVSKFGTVVRALWPIKPALHLSQLEGCSERGAQYQIDGERKVTAKAMHIIDGELLD
jgi:hypothetical protein